LVEDLKTYSTERLKVIADYIVNAWDSKILVMSHSHVWLELLATLLLFVLVVIKWDIPKELL
jgi:hypothetical protein